MTNFLHSLSTFTIKASLVLATGVAGIFGYHVTLPQQVPSTQAPTLGAYNPSGGGTYRLSGSIGTQNTSIRLSSFKEPVSNIPYTMSYLNTDVAYGTLDPQTNVSEFIAFTGITQNTDGSATLTNVTRGLNRTNVGDSCTASSTFKQAHSGQSIFILSNAPCLYGEYVTKRNNETITGIKTFASTSAPKYDFNPLFDTLASTTLASIGYVNQVATSGSPNASETVNGTSQLATGDQARLGTLTGSTGARLVLSTGISTSSPGLSGRFVPVSLSNGRLANGWIDTGSNWAWTGIQFFSGTTTSFFATTTFSQAPQSATSTAYNQLTTQGYVDARAPIAATSSENVSFTTTGAAVGTSTGMTITTDGTQALVVNYSMTAYPTALGTTNVTDTFEVLIDNASVASYSAITQGLTNGFVLYGGSINTISSRLSAGSHTVKYRFTAGGNPNMAVKGTGTVYTIK